MPGDSDDELKRIKEKKLSEMIAPKKGGVEKMSHSYVELTDANFDSTISSAKLPVLVDFWAAWCGPCIMMAPIFEQLAKEYEGKALLAKVNVDENQEVSQKFGIYGIPTFIFFKGGKEVGRVIGAMGASGLKAELNRHL
jgi:thioredoxin 1